MPLSVKLVWTAYASGGEGPEGPPPEGMVARRAISERMTPGFKETLVMPTSRRSTPPSASGTSPIVPPPESPTVS